MSAASIIADVYWSIQQQDAFVSATTCASQKRLLPFPDDIDEVVGNKKMRSTVSSYCVRPRPSAPVVFYTNKYLDIVINNQSYYQKPVSSRKAFRSKRNILS